MHSEKHCCSNIVNIFDSIYTSIFSRTPRAHSRKYKKAVEVNHGDPHNDFISSKHANSTNKKNGLKSRNITFTL
jgi:hypothetical protein